MNELLLKLDLNCHVKLVIYSYFLTFSTLRSVYVCLNAKLHVNKQQNKRHKPNGLCQAYSYVKII